MIACMQLTQLKKNAIYSVSCIRTYTKTNDQLSTGKLSATSPLVCHSANCQFHRQHYLDCGGK